MIAAIVSIFVGNQLSIASMLPGLMIEELDPVVISSIIGIPLTLLLIILFSVIMNRKQF